MNERAGVRSAASDSARDANNQFGPERSELIISVAAATRGNAHPRAWLAVHDIRPKSCGALAAE